MIYVTGDMHGDESRLYDRWWRKLKAGDTLIICGDFGFMWNGSKQEQQVLDYLGSRKFTVCFLDGIHENFDMLNSCRQTIWKGGRVHRICGNLFHLMRGQVYNIDGTTIFTFGGGESSNISDRIDQGKWWKEEFPTSAEFMEGIRNLEAAGGKVDYVLTHEPPSVVKSSILLRRGKMDSVNKLGGYFEEISRSLEFKHWYFGSMHEDRLITPSYSAVYRKIIPIEKNLKKVKI